MHPSKAPAVGAAIDTLTLSLPPDGSPLEELLLEVDELELLDEVLELELDDELEDALDEELEELLLAELEELDEAGSEPFDPLPVPGSFATT
ncbi:MAG: hypothetical protein KDD44_13060 [Bdellovibrionales bacterium]|nr:hypothetical protein [Bdellovibrionales bacterium]